MTDAAKRPQEPLECASDGYWETTTVLRWSKEGKLQQQLLFRPFHSNGLIAGARFEWCDIPVERGGSQ